MEEERQLPDITYIHVEMSDEPSRDMLSLMPSFNNIIATALERGQLTNIMSIIISIVPAFFPR